MPRLSPLDKDQLDAAQRTVFDKILYGPRGKVGGPFPALLQVPAAADLMQELGAWLRFDSNLPADIREIAILVASIHWRCEIEWEAHKAIALQEGVDSELIEAIASDTIPVEASKKERVAVNFCRELQRDKFVSDATYASAVEYFGLDCTVELVVLIGYFTSLAMILNVFESSPADPNLKLGL
ncbi:carboxymuconolactone decarboxylase family protein [Alphaproteobacteria bacterium]|nr:carboxymuconolactone decarboxylase family protein [Alphaproteobacteria bacterium]